MKYQKGSFITVPNSEALKGIHATAQCLFMWLCYHANQEGKCFPSRKRLAELCGVSVDTIDNMTALLIEKRLIVKTTRKKDEKVNKTNLYEVIIGGVADRIGHLADENGEGVADRIGSELNPLSLTQSTEDMITQKTKKFIQELKETMKDLTLNKSQVEEMQKFVSYWTEPNKSKTKVRWEMEKTWDMKRRVGTWMRNSMKFNKSNEPKAIRI